MNKYRTCGYSSITSSHSESRYPANLIIKTIYSIFGSSGQHGRLVCVYLCWHVHQENSSDGSLSLAVTLVRAKQTVSLQDVEEALLPADRDAEYLCSSRHL